VVKELEMEKQICYNKVVDKEPKMPRLPKGQKHWELSEVGMLCYAQECRVHNGNNKEPQKMKDTQIIYTEEMHKQDSILAYMAWNKYYSRREDLLPFKEDLICACVNNLWYKRNIYDQMRDATYETFAFMIARQTISKITRSKQWQFENLQVQSYDEIIEIADGEVSKFEIIENKKANENQTPLEQENIIDDIDRKEVHYAVIGTMKRELKQKILDLTAQGYKSHEIAEQLKCNRSYVIKVKKEYKDKIIEIGKK
jgi:hypothetical protein